MTAQNSKKKGDECNENAITIIGRWKNLNTLWANPAFASINGCFFYKSRNQVFFFNPEFPFTEPQAVSKKYGLIPILFFTQTFQFFS